VKLLTLQGERSMVYCCFFVNGPSAQTYTGVRFERLDCDGALFPTISMGHLESQPPDQRAGWLPLHWNSGYFWFWKLWGEPSKCRKRPPFDVRCYEIDSVRKRSVVLMCQFKTHLAFLTHSCWYMACDLVNALLTHHYSQCFFDVFWEPETIRQNFPTVFQRTVESRCITTTKIHQHLGLRPSRHSDEIH